MKLFLLKHKLPLISLLLILAILFTIKVLQESWSIAEVVTPDFKNSNNSVVSTSSAPSENNFEETILIEYVKVVDSCGTAFNGACVNVRSSPSTSAPIMFRARNGLVLKVTEKVEKEGKNWYKLSFKNEWLRYPERVTSNMYISADFVVPFFDKGTEDLTSSSPATSKHIVVDRSEQMLYAYEGEKLFMKEKVSTGIKLTPTPRGTFTVFKKTPSRYMQGPIPNISDHYYDLPGVPWNLYFTEEGAVIHGAYWHDKFGQVWSNGCVNLPLESAEKLYNWADVGTKIVVRD